MRVHTNTLTEADVRAAATAAGIRVHALSPHRSRSRHHAFDITFEGSSSYGGQYGTTDYKAATWDEWGMALAHLFAVDPEVEVRKIYADADDFHWRTGDRYRSLTPAYQHKRHRWSYKGRAVGDGYVVHECDCGALSRRP